MRQGRHSFEVRRGPVVRAWLTFPINPRSCRKGQSFVAEVLEFLQTSDNIVRAKNLPLSVWSAGNSVAEPEIGRLPAGDDRRWKSDAFC